jgi:predicted nucleotidyltransferase
MIKEIKRIITEMPSDWQFFGFGSFFSDNPAFNDVDLLAVSPDDGCDSMESYSKLRSKLRILEIQFRCRVDLTILTAKEYSGRPLRDMHSLKRLA